MEDKWLTWAKKLQSIAQQGLEYSKDPYDIERFESIRSLSVEIMEDYTGLEATMIKDLFCNESGYQTPKVDIRGVIIEANKILLVKETIDGKWSLPGGWAEFDLSVSENVIKEVKEEAGLNIKPLRIIAVQDRNKNNPGISPYGIYKIFVLCTSMGGNFQKNTETEASGYFPLDALPPLSVGRNTENQILMCFKAAADKGFMTVFD